MIKHFLTRLLIAATPLLALYAYAQMAFRHNRTTEHPTDVGLGIAFLLVLILLVLFLGFVVDGIAQLRKRAFNKATINLVLLLFLMLPLVYLICMMSSRACFCSTIIKLVDFIGPN